MKFNFYRFLGMALVLSIGLVAHADDEKKNFEVEQAVKFYKEKIEEVPRMLLEQMPQNKEQIFRAYGLSQFDEITYDDYLTAKKIEKKMNEVAGVFSKNGYLSAEELSTAEGLARFAKLGNLLSKFDQYKDLLKARQDALKEFENEDEGTSGWRKLKIKYSRAERAYKKSLNELYDAIAEFTQKEDAPKITNYAEKPKTQLEQMNPQGPPANPYLGKSGF